MKEESLDKFLTKKECKHPYLHRWYNKEHEIRQFHCPDCNEHFEYNEPDNYVPWYMNEKM